MGSDLKHQKKEDTTHEQAPFALALAGVMTAVTLTACAPLEDLYDWFFGGGKALPSGNDSLMESVEWKQAWPRIWSSSETAALPEPRRRLRKWQRLDAIRSTTTC